MLNLKFAWISDPAANTMQTAVLLKSVFRKSVTSCPGWQEERRAAVTGQEVVAVTVTTMSATCRGVVLVLVLVLLVLSMVLEVDTLLWC